jgi:putative ABC transport system permease protein
MLGILIGIASVILLTSIGEGTRQYMIGEFTQFGTDLIAINPGRTETTGISAAVGNTVHPLTLDDAQALQRVRGVAKVIPVCMGAAGVSYEGKTRNVFVYGVTHDMPGVWRMGVAVGRFLPAGDMDQGAPLAVLGPKLKHELFGGRNALGEHVRISGQRFLVIGIMESKGEFIGFDLDDTVYIPVALAQPLFNRDDLQEIDIVARNPSLVDPVVDRMRELLIERHSGEWDFTITTQTGMLESLDRIMNVVSTAVAGIAGISLLVGAIGILTMMWISVSERTGEIGLAKAIGATPRQILSLYLAEAAILSTLGGLIGLVVGVGLAQLLRLVVPALPVHTPPLFMGLAVGISLAVGLLSGILPARRAARMDPVEALGAE